VPLQLIGRIAPTRTEGINLRGVFTFPIEQYQAPGSATTVTSGSKITRFWRLNGSSERRKNHFRSEQNGYCHQQVTDVPGNFAHVFAKKVPSLLAQKSRGPLCKLEHVVLFDPAIQLRQSIPLLRVLARCR
jgi:hypothetical protein